MERNQGRNSKIVYGICTNTGGKEDGTPCSKCQNKEKQAIRASKEFICEECGAPLTKVVPPKPKLPKWIYIILALFIVGGGIGAYFGFYRGSGEESVLLSLNKKTVVLDVGDCDTLIATVFTQPIDASVLVIFTSGDENVVQVGNNGLVKAISPGESSITVIAQNENGIADTAKINVTVNRCSDDSVHLSLSINKDVVTFAVGNADTLKAMVTTTPDCPNANVSVSFTSDNTNVAQVDNTGVVRAVAKGETTITVVASSPKGSADTAKVRVTVNEILPKSTPEPDPIPTPKQSKKNHNGTSDQGWYTWDGGYKDGKPHGKGKMRITRTYTIELKDITGSKITVYPGETINAMLDNGRIRGGDIIHKDGSSTTFVNNL